MMRLLSCAAFFTITLAAVTNRTIDDTLGDRDTGFRPVFLPPRLGVWEGSTCAGCAIQPDKAQAFEGTWTAATYQPEEFESMSIELQFTGTAIYVFFILANDQGRGIDTRTTCSFILDGEPAGDFEHKPTDSPDLEYNALVFRNEQMTNTSHTLTIVTEGGDKHIYVNFDYAIYTFDDGSDGSKKPTTSTSSQNPASTNAGSSPPGDTSSGNSSNSSGKSNSAAVAAGTVIALLVGLGAILFGFCYFRRRQQRRARSPQPSFDSLPEDPFGSGHSRVGLSGATSPTHVITPFTSPQRGYSERAVEMASVPPISYDPSTIYTHGNNNRDSTLAYLQSDVESQSAYTGIAPSSAGCAGFGAYQNQSDGSGQRNLVANNDTRERTLPPLPVVTASGIVTSQSRSQPRPSGPLTVSNATTDELREARQEELVRQMKVIQDELNGMSAQVQRKASTRKGGAGDSTEVSELREQINLMREQLELLQEQQGSSWAQGLSDVPPPAYTNAR